MARTVTIRFPKALGEAIAGGSNDPARVLLEAAVLELYREGRLSSSAAADLLEMERYEFIRFAGRRGIPFLDASEEELAEEMHLLGSLSKTLPSE